MSVKFEIADWKFELSLKELVCQPVEVETNSGTSARWEETPTELAERDMLTDCYGREQGLIV
ncbi:MAG: hypothetical protein ABIU20_08875 [Blastocatellia bacterium]